MPCEIYLPPAARLQRIGARGRAGRYQYRFPEMLAEAIVGVGLTKAQAIVAHREVHGPFQSIEELVQVRGIGTKTLEKSRDNLTVGE